MPTTNYCCIFNWGFDWFTENSVNHICRSTNRLLLGNRSNQANLRWSCIHRSARISMKIRIQTFNVICWEICSFFRWISPAPPGKSADLKWWFFFSARIVLSEMYFSFSMHWFHKKNSVSEISTSSSKMGKWHFRGNCITVGSTWCFQIAPSSFGVDISELEKN